MANILGVDEDAVRDRSQVLASSGQRLAEEGSTIRGASESVQAALGEISSDLRGALNEFGERWARESEIAGAQLLSLNVVLLKFSKVVGDADAQYGQALNDGDS